jgi:hypothetical protein
MRTKSLAALATVIAVMGIGIFPSTAAAEKSDCPAGYICAWEGPTFGGARTQFAGSDAGTKALANIDPRSAYNHTGNHTGVFNTWYTGCCPNLILGPGQAEGNRATPYGGELLW